MRQFRSDYGANFAGAERELKLALEEIDHKHLQEILPKELFNQVVLEPTSCIPHEWSLGEVDSNSSINSFSSHA